MSLPANVLGSRARILTAIGIPLAMPMAPRVRPWRRFMRRLASLLTLVTDDLIETAMEAVGFGLLLVLFLFTMYMLC